MAMNRLSAANSVIDRNYSDALRVYSSKTGTIHTPIRISPSFGMVGGVLEILMWHVGDNINIRMIDEIFRIEWS